DISTVLVAGSSGAFFHIADTVIQMDSYRPVDITEKVKALCAEYPIPSGAALPYAAPSSQRIMTRDSQSLPKRRDYRTGAVREDEPEQLKVKLLAPDTFSIGRQNVELRYIEQLIDKEQTAALSIMLKYAVTHLIDGKKTVSEIVNKIYDMANRDGLAALCEGRPLSGGYAMPRIQELYSCFNRYRRS
ncbi:MAG: P-loop domain-containing protein, partial [Lachnospiraceae bacterium]